MKFYLDKKTKNKTESIIKEKIMITLFIKKRQPILIMQQNYKKNNYY